MGRPLITARGSESRPAPDQRDDGQRRQQDHVLLLHYEHGDGVCGLRPIPRAGHRHGIPALCVRDGLRVDADHLSAH